MRVVDGAHRLRAVLLRGEEYIEARFTEGTREDAFVLAVRLNSQQGLPLSQADRTAAAERIIVTHPQWSDRRIAGSTGVSPATVAALRRRSGASEAQLNTRAGRDGRSVRSTRPRGADAPSGSSPAGPRRPYGRSPRRPGSPSRRPRTYESGCTGARIRFRRSCGPANGPDARAHPAVRCGHPLRASGRRDKRPAPHGSPPRRCAARRAESVP
ncbi:hypothetical protein AB5J72_31090 [Streptomyces sp. CG1]|uniref:hypothetical protein n=1 Tax=Streptomyces sp. CG1 TaxID=1287523 RepID=UPI0034E21493